jgi:hypothetical protein
MPVLRHTLRSRRDLKCAACGAHCHAAPAASAIPPSSAEAAEKAEAAAEAAAEAEVEAADEAAGTARIS